MIVDAGDAGNRGDKSVDESGDVALRHAGTQLVRFGVALADGFHRQMEHHFVAAAVRFFGDLDGVRIVGENGNRQRIRQREDRFGSGVVLAEVIEDNREAWSGGSRRELDRGNAAVP